MKGLSSAFGKFLGTIIGIGVVIYFVAVALHKLMEKTQKKPANR